MEGRGRVTRRRTRPRKYVAMREKWAAALSMLLPQAVRDELRERRAPAKEVIALFDQDHVVFHAIGGADRWFNFTPMLRPLHREKSKRDISTIAKVRRLSREQAGHEAAMRAKLLPKDGLDPNAPIGWEDVERRLDGHPWPKRTIPSRPFPKGRQRLQSRNNLRRPG
jgi:hypothetical protein